MNQDKPKKTPEEIVRDLTDDEIKLVQGEAARRQEQRRRERLLSSVAVCVSCGALLSQSEYDTWERHGCPHCGGDRAVPIDTEATA